MRDDAETFEEKKRREDLIKAAIENKALQKKKEKGVRNNNQLNNDKSIFERTDFDEHS